MYWSTYSLSSLMSNTFHSIGFNYNRVGQSTVKYTVIAPLFQVPNICTLRPQWHPPVSMFGTKVQQMNSTAEASLQWGIREEHQKVYPNEWVKVLACGSSRFLISPKSLSFSFPDWYSSRTPARTWSSHWPAPVYFSFDFWSLQPGRAGGG